MASDDGDGLGVLHVCEAFADMGLKRGQSSFILPCEGKPTISLQQRPGTCGPKEKASRRIAAGFDLCFERRVLNASLACNVVEPLAAIPFCLKLQQQVALVISSLRGGR